MLVRSITGCLSDTCVKPVAAEKELLLSVSADLECIDAARNSTIKP